MAQEPARASLQTLNGIEYGNRNSSRNGNREVIATELVIYCSNVVILNVIGTYSMEY